MAEKSIIIIGAGIAGLATGCYGRMNGYRTRILEKMVMNNNAELTHYAIQNGLVQQTSG